MRVPSELYHASAKRLDESIKTVIYDLGVETRTVSQSGFIAHNKRQCFVGEAFAGMKVSLDELEKPGLTLVRFATVKLGWLESKTCNNEERS